MRPDGMRQPWVSDPDFETRLMSDAEIEAAAKRVAAFMAALWDEKRFSPDQPRDDHGRWTSGGAAADEITAPPLEQIEKDKSVNELCDFLADAAHKRNFDAKMITVIDEKEAPVFKVGDTLYTQDGVFHRETGRIYITHHMGWTEDFIGPVISHEIAHAKYAAIAGAIARGDRLMGGFSKFKPKDLKLAGGVTDYSGQYWKVNGRKVAHLLDMKSDRPINETLADVAAIRDARTRAKPSERYIGKTVPPIWNDLFDEIESQYAKGKEGGLFKAASQAR